MNNMYINKSRYANMCKDIDINHCLKRSVDEIRNLYEIKLDDYTTEFEQLETSDRITIVCNYVEWVLRYIYDNNLDFTFNTEFGLFGKNEHYIEVSFNDKYYILCMFSYKLVGERIYGLDLIVHLQYAGKYGWSEYPTEWSGVGVDTTGYDSRTQTPIEEYIRNELPKKLKELYERIPDTIKAWYILHNCNLYDMLCIMK